MPLPLFAFLLSAAAAISLPIGAVLGTFMNPSPGVLAGVLSFGAGVLLSAVSFELIEEAFEAAEGIGPVAIAAVVGALTFLGLNRLLDNLGGFLRKSGTLGQVVRREKHHHAEEILDQLSKVVILQALPPEEIEGIVPYVKAVSTPANTTVFRRGDAGDALYLVVEGELDVLADGDGRQERDLTAVPDGGQGSSEMIPLARLGAGDAFGEMALLTGEPRNATVQARTDASLLSIPKDDFDRLVASSPRLSLSVTELAAERLSGTSGQAMSPEEARRWRQIALRSLQHASLRGTSVDERELANEKGGSAALGIYLGLVLDGLSESLAIGALQTGGAPSLAFLAAVFLSNLPESISSSALMRNLGYGPVRLVAMWGGIVLASGLAAALGAAVFSNAPGFVLASIYAFTAGAILAMLAETAMPEAYEHGGSIVGVATVLGFLASFYLGTLERVAAH